ncbi:PAS domain S-box protein [candidate division KSB1 bacterium]
MKYAFKELVDIPALQELTDELYNATSIPSAIIAMDGEILTGSGWQRICTDFHRKHPEIEKDCIESDVKIRKELDKGELYVIYKCPRGLIDASSPVFIEGEHVANVFAGQLFIEPPDDKTEMFFREQAQKYGFDEEKYIAAYHEIPVYPEKKFRYALSFLSKLAHLVATIGMARLNEKRATEALQESESQLASAMNIAKLGYWELDVESGMFTFSDSFYKIFRTTASEMGGYKMSIADYSRRFVHPEDSPMVAEETRKAIETEDPNFNQLLEHRILYADGSIGHIAVHYFIVKDHHGKTIKTYGVNQDITERKRAEEALTHSHNLMSYVIEHSRSAIAVHDRDLKYIYVSQRYLDEYRVKEKDIIGKHHYDVFPDLPQKWRDVHQKALAGEISSAEDDPYEREDGTVDWTRWECRPWYEKDGSIGGIIVYTEVVTKRKKAEVILQEALRLNNAVIDNAQDGIILYGPDLRYQIWNPFMEKISGKNAKDVIGKHPLEVFPFLQEVGVIERLEQTLLGNKTETIDFPYTIPETGRTGWTSDSLSPIYDSDGKITGIVGIVRDITERKKAEEQILEDKHRLESVINSIPDATVITNDKREILMCNPAFTEIFGYSLDEIKGIKTSVFYADEDSYNKLGKERYSVNAEMKTDRYINYYKRKNGEIFPAETIGTPFKDDSGKTLGFIGIMHDMTEEFKNQEEKQKLEEQLLQAQKMESIGRLAGGIAHDFNNILVGIMGYAELLVMKYPDKQKDEGNAADVILQGAERASDLTKQLLGFARAGKFNPVAMDINKLIEKTVNVSEKIFEKKVEVVYDLDNKLHPVKADTGQMDQVLTNLIINAVDAMPGGGKIEFITQNVVLDDSFSDQFSEFHPGNYIKISVTDSGIGIPKEISDKIFEPFYTTKGKGKGTGLGLATVYGIVKNHNGQIQVSSKPGKGTTFTIYLPSTEEKVAKESQYAVPVKGDATILVVDDEEHVRNLTTKMLEDLGYKVFSAKDGNEALSIYNDNKHLIGLVLLDMIMPQMDGKITNQKLRNINPDVKVVLTSGYAKDGKASEIIAEGAYRFIQKPFKLGELSKTIAEVLQS